MSKMDPPEYSGIFLEPEEIEYQEIDPPLRRLIGLINSQTWSRTYGCCAGHAHHGQQENEKQEFFIGLFVDNELIDLNQLHQWLDEANRLNGPTGVRLEIEAVHKHPFGQGSVDGWYAYRVSVQKIPGRTIASLTQAYRRAVRCLEMAWEQIFATTSPDVSSNTRAKSQEQT